MQAGAGREGEDGRVFHQGLGKGRELDPRPKGVGVGGTRLWPLGSASIQSVQLTPPLCREQGRALSQEVGPERDEAVQIPDPQSWRTAQRSFVLQGSPGHVISPGRGPGTWHRAAGSRLARPPRLSLNTLTFDLASWPWTMLKGILHGRRWTGLWQLVFETPWNPSAPGTDAAPSSRHWAPAHHA